MTIAYHSAQIPADGVVLEADIVVPQQARGMVLFAHGSGSSRFSPRNRYVGGQLQHAWQPSWPTCSRPRRNRPTPAPGRCASTSGCSPDG